MSDETVQVRAAWVLDAAEALRGGGKWGEDDRQVLARELESCLPWKPNAAQIQAVVDTFLIATNEARHHLMLLHEAGWELTRREQS